MRDSKIKLFELIDDMNTTVDMEEGGGLNDAYMTLSRRRRRPRSAFADPDATSAFADPNNPSAFIPDRFPVINRFWGGDVYSNEQLAKAKGMTPAELDAGAGQVQQPSGDRNIPDPVALGDQEPPRPFIPTYPISRDPRQAEVIGQVRTQAQGMTPEEMATGAGRYDPYTALDKPYFTGPSSIDVKNFIGRQKAEADLAKAHAAKGQAIADKPNPDDPVEMHLSKIAALGRRDSKSNPNAVFLSNSVLFESAKNPRGLESILNAAKKGEYGREAANLEVPQEVLNQISRKTGGGLPTIYRDNGGTTIPKERMINDQPHQLSYINPQEAGLLQALGGSGRRVNGIPTYDIGEEFDWSSLDTTAGGTEDERDTGEVAYFSSPTDAPTTTTPDTDEPAATGEEYDLFTGGWSVAPVDKQGNISGDKSANLAVLGPQGEVQTYLGGPDLEPGTFRDPTLWDRLTGKKTDKRGQIFEKWKDDRLPSTYTLDEAKKMLEGDIPKYLWPLWNELKFNAQLTNDQAVNYIASILATPGGGAMLAGDVKYGNWMDTAKYFIEDVYNKEGGLGSVIREQRERQDADRLYNEGLEKYGHERAKLTEEDTSILGLGKVADTIKGVASRAMGGEKPDERSIDAITEAAKDDGGVFTPTSELETWIGRGIDLVNPLSILTKGLSALTGQSVIGSLEKNGLTFTVMSDGSLVPEDLSLSASYDEGNEETIKRTPVKKAAPKAAPAQPEEKGIRRLLARRSDPKKRSETMAREQDIYERIYGRPFNIG